MVSERKHPNSDAITKDRIFPCTRVVLEVIQVINSYGDRTVHYIVSSSTRTECQAVGIVTWKLCGLALLCFIFSFWGLSVLCAFTMACGQTSSWLMNSKWPHGNSLVVTHSWFKVRCMPWDHPPKHTAGGGRLVPLVLVWSTAEKTSAPRYSGTLRCNAWPILHWPQTRIWSEGVRLWLHGSPEKHSRCPGGGKWRGEWGYQRSQENTTTRDDIKSFAPLLGVDAFPQLLVRSDIILYLPYKI